MQEVTTPSQFQKWLRNSKHGDAVIYHVGKTAVGAPAKETAWTAYQLGQVNLVQHTDKVAKFAGRRNFQYIAQRVL